MAILDRDGVNLYYEVHGSGPTLLMSHGFSATSAMWQGQIPGATKVIIEDAGHAANLDQPEAFNAAVTAFLATLRQG